MSLREAALKLHAQSRGKLEVTSKVPVDSRSDLSLAYTPGVAEPCREIAADPALAYTYTAKGNMVAVVSDGSAVLGLGNIGPEAALPVMEGKCVLFKRFAGIDAIPLVLSTQDTAEIVAAVVAVAPTFGGINLEDIAAPRCFDVEQQLKKLLNIPVFHDDQHGTAVVILAALLNAVQVVGKELAHCKLVICGAGAAGTATAKLLLRWGVRDIIMVDRQGILSTQETQPNPAFAQLAATTNQRKLQGGLSQALTGADIFIGLSGPGVATREHIALMAPGSIVFAMANPTPEIFPEEAAAGGAAVIGTGRSDYPNQINNVLCFPGIFRGALDARVTAITEEMMIASATGLAQLIPPADLRPDYIIVDPFDPRAVPAVAKGVG